MKYLLILGYSIATLTVLVGEYIAVTKGHSLINHIILGSLAIWNAFVIYGFLKRERYALNMIKIGSYFQLSVILIGVIAYLTDVGYSMELNEQNITVVGSIAVFIWAAFKLTVTNKHYANT